MTEQPDLTLPERVPEMEQYHKKPKKLLPFAFYALYDMDSEKMEDCRRLCATDIDDDDIQLAPQAHFPNQPLRSIVKYHVELAAQGQFHRRHFIVSTIDDLECKPDLLKIDIKGTGIALVNLQISNIGWYEVKHRDGSLRPKTSEANDQ